MNIRESTDADLSTIRTIERAAFSSDEEADLVHALLVDPTAQPLLSLMALENDRAVGHILFTRAYLAEAPSSLRMSILAPLAVVPDAQEKGIGEALIRGGLEILSLWNVALVFVLGSPEYYGRFGFSPAGRYGFHTPSPIPIEYTDAWMVQELTAGTLGTVHGTVRCADSLNKPEFWSE